ncbi:bifunctional DNA-formamidopyrimidine glycosylase/DNA-(apurinic or apyrimidinic site) lyase [Vibrio sp. SCSIO 43136]|uniref:bifunctional DNA-formamidopyrimidine glycosylase/DNA-(apurinic or apyrimidinic site) lyase n=1 Tax=Vibrio sp. SCSIO 43136 TaxID=2819101 RepID=UPI00207625F4|nr:bifunctional DNA-formamidopyrimidine glycosylase/DNA-(apurinic or apyrimidinic site) lyase [Vibrio sp. SCSIO 43136]USD65144.1 bifunctional DNA-formamidopyrimidine glycosylase/DNA-(apurinic or apyrimidinic site) lyase [Vibrio sp. SCSIO 43136]
MPELPEVEVSRLGITPHLQGHTIQSITVRQPKLRWAVPAELQKLVGEKILGISRRAKYLLIETEKGSAIVHLGMSGSLRVLDAFIEPNKHDHVDLVLSNGKVLRYNDPRRFGAWLYQAPQADHQVFATLGPEPLTDEFCAATLIDKAKNKRVAIKQLIMDNKVVVGVGNIYANEALFSSGIHPQTPAGKVTDSQLSALTDEIKKVLSKAIEQGGTTLKDFNQADGKPGYFAQELLVYGRAGEPCLVCHDTIQEAKVGQRNTFFCSTCQK